MDGVLYKWLGDLIERTHNGPFSDPDPELVFELSMTTVVLLRNRIGDLEERLAEYENDEVRRRRHIKYLERHIKELEAS